MTSVLDFLKSGRLDRVAVGMSNEDVRAILGEPDDVSVQKNPAVWKYGPAEVAFYRVPDEQHAFLASITLYFRDHDEDGPIAPADWESYRGITFDRFRQRLDEHNIRISGGVTSGPHKHLVLESAVRASFDGDRLHSVGMTLKREPKVKQLTVNVTQEDFELIKQWARGRNISAAALCSEWLKEHVSTLQKAGA